MPTSFFTAEFALESLKSGHYVRPVGWNKGAAIGRDNGITKWCFARRGRLEWSASPATITVSWIMGEWESLTEFELLAEMMK